MVAEGDGGPCRGGDGGGFFSEVEKRDCGCSTRVEGVGLVAWVAEGEGMSFASGALSLGGGKGGLTIFVE